MTYTYLLLGALPIIYYLLRHRPQSSPPSTAPRSESKPLPSLLIPAYTSHSRSLPIQSKHAFSYPLLYVGVDIDSLQSGELDLPFHVFRYGSGLRVTGLKGEGYLKDEGGTGGLREKVGKLVGEFERCWLVSIPSFLGFEGINPLSVWYCYSSNEVLLAVILEVHNTFGEKHAYVLRPELEYSVKAKEGYDHSWIFPRSFHVSPFNSRNGFYRLDLINPHPSQTIKVSLHLLTPTHQPKLHAILASHPTRLPIPLKPEHNREIWRTICLYPLSLLSTTPRIMYQAYRLHYEKRLAVYPRPEPMAVKGREGMMEEWNEGEKGDGVGYGIAWQSPGWGERASRKIVESWMKGRVNESGIGVKIVFRDLREDVDIPSEDGDGKEELTITTSDPKFFIGLVASPSADHFLTIAPELSTTVSSNELFLRFFIPAHQDKGRLYHLRMSYFHFFLARTTLSPPPHLCLPDAHFLPTSWTAYLITAQAYLADAAEEYIMHALGATFVPGREPWAIWERALRRMYGLPSDRVEEVGSTIW